MFAYTLQTYSRVDHEQASDKLTMKAIKRAKNTYEKRYEKGRDNADRKRGKPPYSHISLIVLAILESPNRRQTLRGIIEYIQKRFPAYYGVNCPAKGWKRLFWEDLPRSKRPQQRTLLVSSSPQRAHV